MNYCIFVPMQKTSIFYNIFNKMAFHSYHIGIAIMQVRVSEDGHLMIPPALRKELGIQPGTWLNVEAISGGLRAVVVLPPQKQQATTLSGQTHSRLATLKPHPDSVVDGDNGLDKAVAWDESDWVKEWNLYPAL